MPVWARCSVYRVKAGFQPNGNKKLWEVRMDTRKHFDESGIFKHCIEVCAGPNSTSFIGSMFMQDEEGHFLTVDFKFLVHFPQKTKNIRFRVEIIELRKIAPQLYFVKGKIKKVFNGKWKKGKKREKGEIVQEWEFLNESCFTSDGETILEMIYNIHTRFGNQEKIYKA